MELGTSMGVLGHQLWEGVDPGRPDLLPDWPDTQTTALGHVCQILLGLPHVPVDGVHAFLNTLQLLC